MVMHWLPSCYCSSPPPSRVATPAQLYKGTTALRQHLTTGQTANARPLPRALLTVQQIGSAAVTVASQCQYRAASIKSTAYTVTVWLEPTASKTII
jgi:hypothetical protein